MSQSQPSLDGQQAEILRMLSSLDADAPIAVTLVFHVRKRSQSDFESAAAVLARSALGTKGIKSHDQFTHKSIRGESADTLRYLILDKWESVSSFRNFWQSDDCRQFQARVLDWVVSPPLLDFYQGAQHANVLQTGQTHCWDSQGQRIDCNGTGQDGDIRAGVPTPVPRFTDNNDGTVTDELTGLIWLRNANWFGEVAWEAALANARSLAAGSGGLSDGSKPGDWRLPNVNEFQSLLDLNNSSGPAIAPDHPFINLVPSNYWTSSSVALAPPLGWFVALAVGPPVFDLKFNIMRMWPVRGRGKSRVSQTGQTQCFNTFGQPVDCKGTGMDGDIRAGVPLPVPRFSDNGDGTVTDNLTELIWLKNANAFGTRSWQKALDACNSLASGEHGLSDDSKAGQWRLPNLFELRSLMDYSSYNPALTPGHPFQNVIPSLYWSSTTVPSAPNLARFVFVGVGPSVWDHKSVHMHVWPVRGGKIGRHHERTHSHSA